MRVRCTEGDAVGHVESHVAGARGIASAVGTVRHAGAPPERARSARIEQARKSDEATLDEQPRKLRHRTLVNLTPVPAMVLIAKESDCQGITQRMRNKTTNRWIIVNRCECLSPATQWHASMSDHFRHDRNILRTTQAQRH
jgi:hypothetical protein